MKQKVNSLLVLANPVTSKNNQVIVMGFATHTMKKEILDMKRCNCCCSLSFIDA